MSFRSNKAIGARDTKSGINADAARQKRVGQFTQMRNNDREATMESRRRRHNDQVPEDVNVHQDVNDEEDILKDRPNIPILIQNLESTDLSTLQDATFRLRQLVSLVKDPPFDEVTRLGGLPRLVHLLSHQDSKVAFEAAWCLTNVASGNSRQTKQVVDAGAIPPLVELLSTEDNLVRDQAVWALGNLAGESPVYRDTILELGAMNRLLQIAHRVLRLCMLRNVSWCLSNFCRGKNPQPDFEIVQQALPTLHNMLNFRDDDVISDAAWSLSFLSDDTGQSQLPENHKIEMVIHSGVLGRLIVLLSNQNPNIKTPALRTIGNLVTGSNFQTQIVLNANVLPPLVSLLNNGRKSIRREAAWALSNIAAGAKSQVLALVEANVFHALYMACAQADLHIKREIVWVICNAVSNRDPQVLQHIATIGWIAGLIHFLQERDTDLLLCTLDTLHHFLEHGEQNKISEQVHGGITMVNVYAIIVERGGGDKALEALMDCEVPLVYEKACNLLSSFLGYVQDTNGDVDDGTNNNNNNNNNQFADEQGLIGFDSNNVNQNDNFDF